MITLLDKKYHGFESGSDIDRDISEMWMYVSEAQIPAEWKGTVVVQVTYIPAEDEE